MVLRLQASFDVALLGLTILHEMAHVQLQHSKHSVVHSAAMQLLALLAITDIKLLCNPTDKLEEM